VAETRQDALVQRIARAGLRVTSQRLLVLEELSREPHDLNAQDLYRRLRGGGRRIGLATVYRTLGSLAQHGVIDTLAHTPGETCYRFCSDGHHHHLVCSECHRVVELGDCGIEDWLTEAAAKENFVPTAHHVEVVGVCGACR
jgi:Fur family transcriptional regulator, ferric uptake regulator